MTTAIIAFDGTDADAPARRAAARDAHVAFITAEAEAGRLLLGLPLHDEAGRSLGSLMMIAGEEAARDAYLAAEPFAHQGVWQRVEAHPFRIAPLPYQGWPQAVPQGRTHTIAIAWDGTDAGALERRLANRQGHFDRVRPMAADGTLLFGGALLDAAGTMRGSIAVTRHLTHAAVRDWMAPDPYVAGDVWRDIALYGTSFRPLPYKPLPHA
ncbi:YciI family protein [Falsiroseomonas ponticola]|uniref:YciI family protein n=1 Tax=Falsiroseomonas ponticola TaxID=2786951 RepID=UPI001CF76F45|nr:YciI family protein [Roseomonas ponticola]